jgi:hypothetical protein
MFLNIVILLLIVSIGGAITSAIYKFFLYSFNKYFSSTLLAKGFAVGLTTYSVGLGIFLTSKINDKINETGEIGQNNSKDSLSIAQMAFNIPLKMKVGETYEADFYITKSRNKNVLISKFSKVKDHDKFVFVDSFYVSSIVKVNLVDLDIDSSNFKIKEYSPIQEVDSLSTTHWRFRVKPLQGGNNDLLILITTFIKDVPKSIEEREAFRKTITVESNYWYSITDFFEKYWTIFIPLIFVPMFVYLHGVWKATREAKKRKEEDDEKVRMEQVKKDKEAEMKRIEEEKNKKIQEEEKKQLKEEFRIMQEQLHEINELIKKRGGNFTDKNDGLGTTTDGT